MKRINAALRKGADFNTLEMSDEHRKELMTIEKVQAYYQPLKRGFPPYMLTSINAKIKTAKQRAEQVEKKQAIPDKDEEINGIRVEWRASENRIRVFFPGRVDLDTFKALKKHGYRVLRSEGEGAFSAYYNYNAGMFVKNLRDSFKKSFPNTETGENEANTYMAENENMAVIEVTTDEIKLATI